MIPAAITEAIERGQVRDAADMAAKLSDPRDHRDAMIEVNRAMRAQRKPRMIQFAEKPAVLAKFTPYVEMHGKETVPGVALNFTFNVGSDFLQMMDPELRAFFFCKSGAKSHDLADQTAELPNLRYTKLMPKGKYLWRQRYQDSILTVHVGDREDNAIEQTGVVKKPWTLTPMEGGTIIVGMTFQCHPQGEEVTKLYDLQRSDVRISFDPGEEMPDTDPEDDDPPGDA